MNKLAIIGAGHGGGDSGAIGQGTTEAATTIDIVNRLADIIRADGRFEVHVIPHELGLVQSIAYINTRWKNVNDGYALEVHKNSAVGAHGVETWYFSGYDTSKAYAQKIQNGLKTTGLPDRGVKGDATNRYGRLGFIRDTNVYAGLAECGFITNGGDPIDPNLYATGLYKGFLELFGLPPKAVPVPPKPTPVPPATTISYRVTNLDGKQIGAYKEAINAWLKYESVQGSARIFDSAGKDVTGEFVEKYRPKPTPTPQPDPVDTSNTEARISALEKAVKAITDFLSSIFTNFKKG